MGIRVAKQGPTGEIVLRTHLDVVLNLIPTGEFNNQLPACFEDVLPASEDVSDFGDPEMFNNVNSHDFISRLVIKWQKAYVAIAV